MYGIDSEMIDSTTITLPWYIWIPLALYIWYKVNAKIQADKDEAAKYRAEMIAKYGSWENYERQMDAYINSEVHRHTHRDE